MTGELINDRQASNAAHSPLALEHPLHVKETDPFAIVDRYKNTLASCNDFPVPTHAAKSLFIEKELETYSPQIQEKQKQLKNSFLHRLTLSNIKKQMNRALVQIRDTLISMKDHVKDFFTGSQTHQKSDQLTQSLDKTSKQASVGNQKKAEKKQETTKSQTTLPVEDAESRRIREIEEALATYETELNKSGGGDIKAMIEMACKMAILVGSLGYRYNKQEMNDYMDHLEVNIKKRVKTFENGHTWTYLAVGFYTASAVASFLSVGGAFGNFAAKDTFWNNAGKMATAFGGASQPLGSLGGGTDKMGQIESEKKNAKRTQFEHDGEKLKTGRSDRDRSNEKTNQLIQEMFAALRALNQTNTEAVKRAAAN